MLDRQRQMAKEARGIGVLFVQRQPGHGSVLACAQLRMPLRQQCGLAESGRCQQQGEWPGLGLIQRRQQGTAHHRTGTRQRRLQLAGKQPIGKGGIARR